MERTIIYSEYSELGKIWNAKNEVEAVRGLKERVEADLSKSVQSCVDGKAFSEKAHTKTHKTDAGRFPVFKTTFAKGGQAWAYVFSNRDNAAREPRNNAEIVLYAVSAHRAPPAKVMVQAASQRILWENDKGLGFDP